MRKVTVCMCVLLIAAAFASPAAASGKVVTIGTHASGNYIPWYGQSWNSCRFQCLWFQTDIGASGYINAIEFEKSNSASGTFNDVRVWLCHTAKTGLEATFNNNYTTFTPVQVRTGGNLAFTGTGYFDLGITPNAFNYNNSNNLLMEVRWNGDSGTGVPCWRSSGTAQRLYASDHNASSGSVSNTGQCIRLYLGTMTGLEPTSLGRVKSLYR